MIVPDFVQPRLAETVLVVGGACLLVPLRVVRERAGDLVLLVVAASAVGAVASMDAPHGFLFHRMLVVDPFAAFFKFLLSMTALAVAWMSTRSEAGAAKGGPASSWAFLVASLLAMDVAVAAVHVMTAWAALEAANLATAAWIAARTAEGRGEGSVSAVVVEGRAASALMLLGFALLFGLTGTLSFPAMADKLPLALASPGGRAVMFAGLALVVAGFASRLALQPWSLLRVDEVDGSSLPVASWLAIAPTMAGAAMLTRFLRGVVAHPVTDGAWNLLPGIAWADLLSFAAAATMVTGAAATLRAKDGRRLAAWTAASQAGFLAMGLVVANDRGVEAMLVHAVAFALGLGGVFAVLACVSRDGHGADLEDLRGLARRSASSRGVAAALVVFLLSLAAVPFLAGHEGRTLLMSAVFDAGRPLLAMAAVLASGLGLANAAKIVALLLDRPVEGREGPAIDFESGLLLLLLLAGVVALGIFPEPLASFAARSAAWFPG